MSVWVMTCSAGRAGSRYRVSEVDRGLSAQISTKWIPINYLCSIPALLLGWSSDFFKLPSLDSILASWLVAGLAELTGLAGLGGLAGWQAGWAGGAGGAGWVGLAD